MAKNSQGQVNQRGFRYADTRNEKTQKIIKQNDVFLRDPIPIKWEGILRQSSRDSSKILHASPFMKTRAYGDMEKLFEQNNISFRNHIMSPSKSRDQEKDKEPNQSPDPEDEMPDFVRKRLQKLKNQ